MRIRLNGIELESVTLERVFQLPPGSITESYGNDPALTALMHLVEVMPWLIEVAECNFDKNIAMYKLINEAAKAACLEVEK